MTTSTAAAQAPAASAAGARKLPLPVRPFVAFLRPGRFPKFGYTLLALIVLIIGFGAVTEVPKPAGDEASTSMMAEFNADVYVELPKLGPIDLSITKPVLYMWMAMLLCVGFSVWQARRMRPRPNRKQTLVEFLYEFLHDQVAKSTLPDAVFSRYMPYLAAVFLFIWTLNLVSFLPLPFGAHSWLSEEGGPPIRDLGLYAATSNINVTFTLTLATVFLTHFLGVRAHGPVGYLKTWAPPGNMFMRVMLWLLHAVGECVKLISLSVRLFANMLTGHMLILVMFTIIFVIGVPAVAVATLPVAIVFFLFEVGLVATLQAYIFAVLSGSYMGMAASEHH